MAHFEQKPVTGQQHRGRGVTEVEQLLRTHVAVVDHPAQPVADENQTAPGAPRSDLVESDLDRGHPGVAEVRHLKAVRPVDPEHTGDFGRWGPERDVPLAGTGKDHLSDLRQRGRRAMHHRPGRLDRELPRLLVVSKRRNLFAVRNLPNIGNTDPRRRGHVVHTHPRPRQPDLEVDDAAHQSADSILIRCTVRATPGSTSVAAWYVVAVFQITRSFRVQRWV